MTTPQQDLHKITFRGSLVYSMPIYARTSSCYASFESFEHQMARQHGRAPQVECAGAVAQAAAEVAAHAQRQVQHAHVLLLRTQSAKCLLCLGKECSGSKATKCLACSNLDEAMTR